MKATLPLNEEEIAEAIRAFAIAKGCASAGTVRLVFTPGDRPFDNGSFSATVEVEIEPKR